MLGFRLGIRGTVNDLRGAVELSADHPGTWQRVVVCCEHSRLLLWAGDAGRGRAALEEAVVAVENTTEQPVEDADEWARARAYTWGQSAMLAAFERQGEGAVEVARRGAEEGARVRDGVTILHATFWGAAALAGGGPTSTEYVDEGRLLMERVGAPHRYVAWLSASMADDLFVVGDVRRCVERLRVALGSDAGLAGNYAARLTAAVLAAWQGRHDEAEGHLARSRELIEDGSAYPNFAAARSTAWVLLLRGDALPAVDVAEAAMRREGPYPTGCEWLAPLAARGLADLVRTELDAGRSPEGPRSRLAALRDCFPHVLEDAGTRTDDYAQIAGELFVSEKTVSSHISNILHKTGTANRVELAAWATRRGAGS